MLIQKVLPVHRAPFQTQSPFLFAVYHLDKYPPSRPEHKLGVDPTLLRSRNLGMDFGNTDWNMYHGTSVPGFPQHPHCGFSTITLVRRGCVDHHDSLGSYGRFANGDTQWMDAGRGVSHSEMIPLLDTEHENTLDLFQIWINLPRANKGCDPNYTMQWREQAVKAVVKDEAGLATTIETVAGQLDGFPAPQPPPTDNYAHDPEHCVAIWIISMEPGARWTIPAAPVGVNRSVIFFKGEQIVMCDEHAVKRHANMHVDASMPCPLHNVGSSVAEILMLQGRAIDEPVIHNGPFVANSQPEMMQAVQAYREGKFGKWPFSSDAPVLPREAQRFAHYSDGREERPDHVANGI